RSGDRHSIASQTALLGEIYYSMREYPQARDYFQQALNLRHQIDDRRGIVSNMKYLASIAREMGDYAEAMILYQQAIALALEYKFIDLIRDTLREIAELLRIQEKRRAAMILIAFVRAKREVSSGADKALIEQLESEMTPESIAEARAVGETLTLEEVSTRIAQ